MKTGWRWKADGDRKRGVKGGREGARGDGEGRGRARTRRVCGEDNHGVITTSQTDTRYRHSEAQADAETPHSHTLCRLQVFAGQKWTCSDRQWNRGHLNETANLISKRGAAGKGNARIPHLRRPAIDHDSLMLLLVRMASILSVLYGVAFSFSPLTPSRSSLNCPFSIILRASSSS